MSKPPLKVCFITDEKPGHKNQLLGLEQSMKLNVSMESQWISINDVSVSWFDVVSKRCNVELEQAPDIVVGAGNSTHKLVLAIKRKYQCFSVILMKPSVVPMGWFDALIVPEHDNPPKRPYIYASRGVLNKVRPRGSDYQSSRKGLVLVGGDSKHYHWDSASVWSQIDQVVSDTNDIDHWVIADSRRTPEGFQKGCPQHLKEITTYIDCKDTTPEWLPAQMAESDRIWVTPDSVSMVYEALTSGAIVGLFDLPAVKQGRIVKGLNVLNENNMVVTFKNSTNRLNNECTFCEADNSANWLLDRYLSGWRG